MAGRRTLRQVKRTAWYSAILVGVLALPSVPVIAALRFAFAVEDIQADSWAAHGIAIDVTETAADVLALSIELAELSLPDDYGSVHGLRLTCPNALHDAGGWACGDGRLQVDDSPLQAQDATWQGTYAPEGDAQLTIPKLALAGGEVAITLTRHDDAWTLRVQPKRVALARIGPLGRALELPRDWQIKGRTSGSLEITGAAASPQRLSAELAFDQWSYASPDGLQAAENINAKLHIDAQRDIADWRFDARLAWPGGALYSDPLYLDAAQGAIEATVTGRWSQDPARLNLDSWSVLLAQTAHVSGTGRFGGAEMAVEDLTIAAQSDDAGRLYRRLLQPFLIGSAVDDMQVGGQVGVVLHFDSRGVEQAGLQLHDLALSDQRGRFTLGRTSGSVAWERDREVSVSRLEIADAALYRIPTGGFAIRARFAGERFELLEPVVVPLLGGEVALDSFVLNGALVADSATRWQASASLHGVSLEQLTAALQWPPFGGVVTGQLRDMRYADQVFTIGGGLEMSAFGGEVRVTGLRIQEPFGAAPVLSADATLRGLNLEALTNTFSFGRIEGQLDGDVEGLQLVGWQPAHFGMHLYTPAGDDSRHRISQRAVENLTELGSGIPAGLSSTVLSVFDEFRYDRIDLRIALDGERAQIDGLARPDGGYYLVKGAGLPRIDVIGRNRSVAWKELVERLRQIRVEGAQVK